MFKYAGLIVVSGLFALVSLMSGCSESQVTEPGSSEITFNENEAVLVYERAGLVDSIIGTCSAWLPRTYFIDTLDFRNVEKVKIEFNAFTSADLSLINVYYVNDSNVNIVEIEGYEQINGTKSIILIPPKIKDMFFIRMSLWNSTCTGEYFSLRMRDFRIYTN